MHFPYRSFAVSALAGTLMLSSGIGHAALTLTSVQPGGVTGNGAPPNHPVELLVNGLSQGSLNANGSGAFTFNSASITASDRVEVILSRVWNFNTDGNAEGWLVTGGSAPTVSAGTLKFTANGGNGGFYVGTGNPGTDAVAKVSSGSLTRVVQFRYRIIGGSNPGAGGTIVLAGYNNAGVGEIDLLGQGWNPRANAGFITTAVDVSVNNTGATSTWLSGKPIIQLVVGANGFQAGDQVEVDFVRVTEGFMWDFTHTGDTMDWSPTPFVGAVAAASVANGSYDLTYSPLAAGGPNITLPFNWISASHFRVFSNSVRVTSNSVQIEFLKWIDSGGANSYGVNGNEYGRLYNSNNTFQSSSADLPTHTNPGPPLTALTTVSWGQDPTSIAFQYNPYVNGDVGTVGSIDSLRLFPLNAFGPSPATTIPAAGVRDWTLY